MNKKLYKIIVCHYAPKDSHTSVECFLLAENDLAVYEWVDKELNYGGWSDIDDGEYLEEGEENTFEIYDEDYKVIGTETYKEKMIRIKGDINDEDYDYSDAYYGITQHGWEEVECHPLPVATVVESLKKVGILNEV